MKYFKRLGIYKASNVTFDPVKCEAHSYGHWKFVAKIEGKVVFNGYRYSNSTSGHQAKVRRLLRELGIKIDIEVSSRSSLANVSLVALLAEKYEAMFNAEIKLSRAREKGFYQDQINELNVDIKFFKEVFKMSLSPHEIVEIKKKCLESDENNRQWAREKAKQKRELKQQRLFRQTVETSPLSLVI